MLKSLMPQEVKEYRLSNRVYTSTYWKIYQLKSQIQVLEYHRLIGALKYRKDLPN